jgi:uncharacterized protein DUF4239
VSEWIVVNVPTWLMFLAIVGGLPAVAVGVQALVRRLAPAMRQGEHNDVAGFLIAVIGVVYAVVVAFVIVALWEDFTDVRSTVRTEAAKLSDLSLDAAAFGEPTSSAIRRRSIDYARAVASDEWRTLQRGQESERARAALGELAATFQHIEVRNQTQAAFLDDALVRLNDLGEARESRVQRAQESLPGVMWAAILLGSVVTLAFCLLFGLEDARLHYLMVAGVAAIIAINLFLVLVLDHPFAGDVSVRPEAFEHVLADLAAGG